jgi:hypothetical protein
MGIFGSIGRGVSSTVKSCVNVKGWIGYNTIKSQTTMLVGLGKAVYFPKKRQIVKETQDFETVLKQLNVSEEELKKRAAMYLKRSILFLGIGLLGLIYAVYVFYRGYISGGILTLLLTGIFFMQAFSMSLYYVQIKRRKLGFSVTEWFGSLVGRE